MLVFFTSTVFADEAYTVQSSFNDQDFIINEIEYSAKSFCPDFTLGDQVIFLTGNPNGSCTDAMIMNARTNQICDVWCQYPL